MVGDVIPFILIFHGFLFLFSLFHPFHLSHKPCCCFFFKKMQILTFIFSVLLPLSALAQSFYLGSQVVELSSPAAFKKQVLDTRHPTIVEFYAPWCGHCQSLKPDFLRAAKALKGVANLHAVDCDQDSNKGLCEQYNVKGFPTLKLFGPSGKTRGTARSDFIADYQGPRTGKAIKAAVLERLNGAEYKVISSIPKLNEKFGKRPRVVLASAPSSSSSSAKKDEVPAVWKALAVEFDQRAYLKNKDESPLFAYLKGGATDPALKAYGVDSSQSALLIFNANETSSDTADGTVKPIVYQEAMDRESIRKFLNKHFDILDPLDPMEKKHMSPKKRKEIRESRLKARNGESEKDEL